MKIAYFNYLYDIQESSAGAAAHVEELARALRSIGHDVRHYYLNAVDVKSGGGKPSLSVRIFIKEKFRRYLSQLSTLLRNIRYFFTEWSIIQSWKPDVILTRYDLLTVSIHLVARLKRIPLVLEVNAPMAYECRTFNENVISLPLLPEWLERLNVRLAARVIVVSEELKQFLGRYRNRANKIRIIPNGADIIAFYPDRPSHLIRDQYNLSKFTVIGFSGSFHYWHGMDILHRLIEETLSTHMRSAFLLIGEGPHRSRLVEHFGSNHEGRVILPGNIDHEAVPDYISAMDIVVAPYPPLDFFYYSPLKVFEYMAAGKPVVATRIGQISSVIVHELNGLLFNPGSYDQLRDHVFRLVEDRELRHRLGRKARETIVKDYSWKHSAEGVAAVLREASDASH